MTQAGTVALPETDARQQGPEGAGLKGVLGRRQWYDKRRPIGRPRQGSPHRGNQRRGGTPQDSDSAILNNGQVIDGGR